MWQNCTENKVKTWDIRPNLQQKKVWEPLASSLLKFILNVTMDTCRSGPTLTSHSRLNLTNYYSLTNYSVVSWQFKEAVQLSSCFLNSLIDSLEKWVARLRDISCCFFCFFCSFLGHFCWKDASARRFLRLPLLTWMFPIDFSLVPQKHHFLLTLLNQL